MKLQVLLFVFSSISFVLSRPEESSRTTASDLGASCIVSYLKSTNKLPSAFPDIAGGKLIDCRTTTSIIYRSLTSLLCGRLLDVKTENVDCVMQQLSERGMIDLLLILDTALVHVDDDNAADETIKELRMSTEHKLKELLLETARVCENDPNYGGLFDKLLGYEIDSISSIERRNYCYAKFAIESDLIENADDESIDLNPRKISTFDIDCRAMIIECRREREMSLRNKLKLKRISSDQLQCVMDKYQIERAFDTVLALKVINNLSMSSKMRRTNLVKVNNRLSNFISGMIMCTGSLERMSTAKISDSIFLLQH